MKKIAIGAGIIIGLVVIILAVLPFAVDLNRHKPAILDRIKAVTDRQVDFEEIDLTILSGLGAKITGLRIADDGRSPGGFPLAQGGRVKVGTPALLKKQIEVRGWCSRSRRSPSSGTGTGHSTSRPCSCPRRRNRPRKDRRRKRPGRVPWTASWWHVEVKDGILSYTDEKAKPGAEPFTVSDIDLGSRDISLISPSPFPGGSGHEPQGPEPQHEGHLRPGPEGGGSAGPLMDVELLLDSVALSSLRSSCR
jgi:hypothetical protein